MWRVPGLKMASPKLSVQDKKDLDKFAKYLVYKCIQIIVQSRLGEKVNTTSKAFSSGSDWFNLAIVDIPEVKAETVKVFAGSLMMGQNVCVEISLKTADGETMILETWWVTMTEQLDPASRVSYSIYNRMAVLLKSLFSVSRSTPAYQLSRKQGPETFVICYRIYMGEPQTCHLGDGYKTTRVGGVSTPIGTYGLTVTYRTKMLISPHTSTKDLCEDLKENHFNSDSSPRRIMNQSQPCQNVYRERRLSSGDDLMFGEPQDICATTFTSSPTDHLCMCTNGCVATPPHPTLQRKPSADSTKDDDNKENTPRPERLLQKGPRICAFAPYLQLDSTGQEEEIDIPFSSLLCMQHRQSTPNANLNANLRNQGNQSNTEESGDNTSDEVSRSSTGSSSTGNRSVQSQGSGAEDFVMVELKTPFAGPESNSDLGRFYQECQVAPPLSLFQETATVQDTLNSITDQLAGFEASSKDFTDFVDTLQGGSDG